MIELTKIPKISLSIYALGALSYNQYMAYTDAKHMIETYRRDGEILDYANRPIESIKTDWDAAKYGIVYSQEYRIVQSFFWPLNVFNNVLTTFTLYMNPKNEEIKQE